MVSWGKKKALTASDEVTVSSTDRIDFHRMSRMRNAGFLRGALILLDARSIGFSFDENGGRYSGWVPAARINDCIRCV